MAKRGRPRKPTGNIPPPPDRKAFERQHFDAVPRRDQRLLEYQGSLRRPVNREAFTGPECQKPEGHEVPVVGEILVPMVCAVKKTPFFLRFKETAAGGWRFASTILVGDAVGVAVLKLDQVPINEMNWLNAICPACNSRCAPILCGGCKQFVCDGGVSTMSSSERLHRCACGSMGIVAPTLKTIAAANGAEAREPGGSRSSSPATPLLLQFRGK